MKHTFYMYVKANNGLAHDGFGKTVEVTVPLSFLSDPDSSLSELFGCTPLIRGP